MRLPSLLRRTPFRLTLLFLALFAAAASAILAYVYFASANRARNSSVSRKGVRRRREGSFIGRRQASSRYPAPRTVCSMA